MKEIDADELIRIFLEKIEELIEEKIIAKTEAREERVALMQYKHNAEQTIKALREGLSVTPKTGGGD